jgi:hypothetical protein
MDTFSHKTAVIALATIFGAATLGVAAHDRKIFAATEEQNLCVDNLLIPTNAEQVDFLRKHAAAAYAVVDRTRDPKDSPLLVEEIVSYTGQGKTVTIKGFNPNGSTATLPDGTKRPVGCYDIAIR